MPLTIRAFTVLDENGDFNIYINEELSDQTKRDALDHEMGHIKRNDFSLPFAARIIESLAD